MKTPSQNTTEANARLQAIYYYGPEANGQQTRISLDTIARRIVIDTISTTEPHARVPGSGRVTLPLDGIYGTDIYPLETPMCDPATGQNSFSMVLRSPCYTSRKTSGPIL